MNLWNVKFPETLKNNWAAAAGALPPTDASIAAVSVAKDSFCKLIIFFFFRVS